MMTLTKRSRRDLLLLTGAAGIAGLRADAAVAQEIRRTPSQILGPFYPLDKPLDQDADLTTVAAAARWAR